MSSVPTRCTVRSPEQLTKLLEQLKRAVSVGELRQLSAVSDYETRTALSAIKTSGPWPDVLEMRFTTIPEGETYRLYVEAHRGPGGTWGPSR